MKRTSPMFAPLALLAALAGLSLLACSPPAETENTSDGGTGGGTGGGTTGGGSGGAATGDPDVLVGSFQVQLAPPVAAMNGNPASEGKTSVLGKIYDGPTPSQLVWEQGTKEGACQILTPRVPFCSTPCGGSAVCVEDETCQDYPAAHSAGTVTATGIATTSGEAAFVMAPVANNYQPPAGVQLAYPAFAEGDEIRMEASGDFFAAFTVTSAGVSPLVVTNDTIPLQAGTAVPLAWEPPQDPDLSTIHVKLDISHHGGTKGMIECDAADTGSLELPAALVTELLGLGVAGFPTVIVTRRAVGSVTIAPGRVDLVVSSSVEHAVQIDGVTSCSADADCPDGQTCQSDLTCQ